MDHDAKASVHPLESHIEEHTYIQSIHIVGLGLHFESSTWCNQVRNLGRIFLRRKVMLLHSVHLHLE